MEQKIIDIVRTLRQELNSLAERSGEEKATKAHLINFLKENTSLIIADEGQWLCAIHKEQQADETIAFRADMDALPFGDKAAHLCGHDGHSAVLAGLGLLIENKIIGKNIVLIFQHAEEIGTGGKVCCNALEQYNVKRVYAFHNIPNWDEGKILLRRDTFACASLGMIINFKGSPSHAAYPQNGKNPGFAAARLIAKLPQLTDSTLYSGLTMATLIGAQIGAKAFGSAAADAEVWLTLRAWHQNDINKLIELIKQTASTEAVSDNVEVSFSVCDEFPATVNDGETLEQLEQICRNTGLDTVDVPEPFRWSEDFGYYGKKARAVMVGIGAGVNSPQLHTQNYVFNDNIIPSALKLFYALAQFG